MGLLQEVIYGLHQDQATEQQMREFLQMPVLVEMAMMVMEADLFEQAKGKGRGGKGKGKGKGKGSGKGKGKFEL